MTVEMHRGHPTSFGYPDLPEGVVDHAVDSLSDGARRAIEQPHLTLHITRTELGRKAFKLIDDAWDELPFRVRIGDTRDDIYLTEGEIFAEDTIDEEPYPGDMEVRGVEAIGRFVEVRRESEQMLGQKILEKYGLKEPVVNEAFIARRAIEAQLRERNYRLMFD